MSPAPALIVVDVEQVFDHPSLGRRNNPDCERNSSFSENGGPWSACRPDCSCERSASVTADVRQTLAKHQKHASPSNVGSPSGAPAMS
jgi:hypothetical protein